MNERRCAGPVTDEVLVAYLASELDPAAQAQLEEHLFACESCTAAAARIADVVQIFRSGVPPVVARDELEALRARGLAIVEHEIAPGVRQEVRFPRGVDLLVHRLRGMDLAHAERVEVTVRCESTRQVMFEELFAPFDRERGEVLIACQRHFVAYPPDVQFDVRVLRPDGAPPTTLTYAVPHHYEA